MAKVHAICKMPKNQPITLKVLDHFKHEFYFIMIMDNTTYEVGDYRVLEHFAKRDTEYNSGIRLDELNDTTIMGITKYEFLTVLSKSEVLWENDSKGFRITDDRLRDYIKGIVFTDEELKSCGFNIDTHKENICTCPIHELAAFGCQCGAFQREQEQKAHPEVITSQREELEELPF